MQNIMKKFSSIHYKTNTNLVLVLIPDHVWKYIFLKLFQKKADILENPGKRSSFFYCKEQVGKDVLLLLCT